MTTLLHLTQSIADMQNELTREQRFSSDAPQSVDWRQAREGRC